MYKYVNKILDLFSKRSVKETKEFNYIEGEIITIDIEMGDLMGYGANMTSLKNLICEKFGADSFHDIVLNTSEAKGFVDLTSHVIEFELTPEDLFRGADQWLMDIDRGIVNLTPGTINFVITKIK